MSKYSKNNSVSEKTKHDAIKIAKGTQKPGQTKEQTRLIAQGVQKGIELYKKQHKEKQRELDKRSKKITPSASPSELSNESPVTADNSSANNKLPWALLTLSWLGFAAYVLLTKSTF